MARAATRSGISTIAATPHLHPDFPGVQVRELAAQCQALREELVRAEIPLQVISGGEVSLNWALQASDAELRLASYGQRGTDLLIETPFTHVVPIEALLHLTRVKRYRVILAHPERSPHFQRDGDPLTILLERGVLLQLNADSLIGSTPRGAPRRLARELLSSGRAHVIASDAHRGTEWRPVTSLPEAVEAAAGLVGPDRARWMTVTAPAAIIAGHEIPAPPPISLPVKRRRFFGIR